MLVLASCSNTKNFTKNQYLLTQNKVGFVEKNPGIETSELQSLMQQRSNKAFLGVLRFKLWAYNRAVHRNKETRFNRWMENTVGERPAILDTSMAAASCREMEKYLGNVGYFYSEVDYQVDFREKRKRAHIRYIVSPSTPYRIKDIHYEISDPVLAYHVIRDTTASLVKSRHIYNVYTLDKERERIAIHLANNGYYGFVKDYVFFEVDSSFNTKEMAVYVKIKNRTFPDPDSAGKFIEKPHYRYMIDKVIVRPNYDPVKPFVPDVKYDTLVDEVHQINKYRPANYYFIVYRGKLRINPNILTQSILIENDEPYNLKDVQETYKRLRYLSIYSYTNIHFVDKDPSSPPDSSGYKPLICNVNLQRAKLHQYSVEAEGTNSGGDMGIGGNVTYRNRNFFRNGETFQLKLRGAMEAQRSNTTEPEDEENFLFFNTFEWGVEAAITFPRFLMPVKMERFPKYFKPNTTLSTGFNYRKRPTYDRYIYNLTFGYNWQESPQKTHIFQLFNISSVKMYPTPEFTQELENINDARLTNQYTDHLITAMQYSFIFNNQDIKKIKNFIYFRGDIETSGNIFYAFNSALESKKDTAGYYTITGIPYAQYGKLEVDFRYYWVFSRNTQLVMRLNTGIGIPYGNSDVLPFEKGFYLGGANSMRAWIYRGLGPGGFPDAGGNIDKMGEILIESNMEYRFPVYSFVKGAVFYDIGNVWLLHENDKTPNAEFKYNTFYKQLAMDAGVGIRLDFKFFIFRLDFAWRLRDPSKIPGERWVAKEGVWFWNFGIGYPF